MYNHTLNHKDKAMECSICYDNLTLENIVNTRCDHVFCKGCFWKWANNDNTCPMCRSGVVTNGSLNKEVSSLRANIFELTQEETGLYDNIDYLRFEERELEENVFQLQKFRKEPRKQMKLYMKKRKKHLNVKKDQAKIQKCNVLIQLDTYSKYYDNCREILAQIKWEKEHDTLNLELLNMDFIPLEGTNEDSYTTPTARLEAQSPPPIYRNRFGGEIGSDEEITTYSV